MSKLLKTLLTVILVLSLSIVFVGCNDDGDNGGDAVTGEFVYQLETGEKEVDGEEVEYSYYKITGYKVTSSDALKMAQGDFSSVDSTKRNIKILPTYKDLPVEEIASMAFANQVILQSVDFAGSNIKTIGLGAFAGCTYLEEIKNLSFIGKSADAVGSERTLGHLFGSSSESELNTVVTAKTNFEDAEAAVTYNVPTSLKKVTFVGTIVPECAFYGFSMLREVVIDNAEEIGAGSFSGCSQLVTINMPKVKTIYDGAFENCSYLIKADFTNNTTLEYIGDNAFSGCARLGFNYIIENEASLTLKLPSSVTYLGKGAFYDCASLKYIELGAGIEVIQSTTFANCTELKKVTYLYQGSDFAVEISAFAECDKDVVSVYNYQGVKQTYSDYVYGNAVIE